MTIRSGLVTLLAILTAGSLAAQDRSYGRSVVSTPYGIVASSWVQASQAGARILEQGGSAVDAAIATNAVLNTSEPMMNGMGGDLFAIYWDAKSGKLYGLNASGWAPQALTIDHLKAKGITSMPQLGIDSVTVPGMVDGWTKLHDRFGKLPWHDLFEPAIFYADHGVAVPEMIHDYWVEAVDRLQHNPESQRVFLPNNQAPATGQIFRNADLANSLRLIADRGEEAFYRGAIAQAILKTSAEQGGTMTADDPRNIPPSGSSPSPPPTATGPSTSCRPTATAWPPSKCSTSWSSRSPGPTARSAPPSFTPASRP
jgi:gamma-glutamyltranspeptidase/glutathione hydrolase